MNRRERSASRLQAPNAVRLRERLVGHATAFGVLQDSDEAISVVPLACVEAKHLLVNVCCEMERTRCNVGSVQRALEAGPEVLNRVLVWTRPSTYFSEWSMKW